jgi:hypothetical protein
MIATYQIEYNIHCHSSRLAKSALTKSIVQIWRHEQTPSGRFLKMNQASGLWDDVGDREAHNKTAQALREKAPDIRRGKREKWGGWFPFVSFSALVTGSKITILFIVALLERPPPQHVPNGGEPGSNDSGADQVREATRTIT